MPKASLLCNESRVVGTPRCGVRSAQRAVSLLAPTAHLHRSLGQRPRASSSKKSTALKARYTPGVSD